MLVKLEVCLVFDEFSKMFRVTEHALNLERGQGQLSHIGSWANVGN